MAVTRMLIASTFLTEFIKPQKLRETETGKTSRLFQGQPDASRRRRRNTTLEMQFLFKLGKEQFSTHTHTHLFLSRYAHTVISHCIIPRYFQLDEETSTSFLVNLENAFFCLQKLVSSFLISHG